MSLDEVLVGFGVCSLSTVKAVVIPAIVETFVQCQQPRQQPAQMPEIISTGTPASLQIRPTRPLSRIQTGCVCARDQLWSAIQARVQGASQGAFLDVLALGAVTCEHHV